MNANIRKNSGAVIVSWDFSNRDTGVLIVGKQKNGKIDIINAFQGDEAYELYQKLTVKNGDKND